jgi:hypothetical protein
MDSSLKIIEKPNPHIGCLIQAIPFKTDSACPSSAMPEFMLEEIFQQNRFKHLEFSKTLDRKNECSEPNRRGLIAISRITF